MSPIEVIGRIDLLPTMMDEGTAGLSGQKREMLPGLGVVWFNALLSATHSVSEGDIWTVIILK
jgi:hypothetical protein